MQIVIDTWRAFLVILVVAALRREPPVQNQWPPAVQNQWQAPSMQNPWQAPVVVNPEPRPIRRVGTAIAELAESVVSLLK